MPFSRISLRYMHDRIVAQAAISGKTSTDEFYFA
jgi:hypothetical protein